MKDSIYHKINFYILLLAAVFLPIWPNFINVWPKSMPILIILYIINWLLLQITTLKFKYFKTNIKNILFLSSLFLLYLASMLYTSNIKNGWFDIEIKLSLFILPFFILTAPQLSAKKIESIFKAFLLGSFITLLINSIHSLMLYNETGALNSFVYKEFAYGFHPTYFAMYLNFAVIVLFGFLFEKEKKYSFEKYFYIFLILLFSVSIVLANSKAVIITLLITLITGAIYYGFRKGYPKLTLLLTLLFIGSFSVIVYKTPLLFNRISDSKRIVNNFFNSEKLKDYEGTSQRILVWRSSLTIIKENFLTGVGAGDVKDVLNEDYTQNNYKYILEKGLNSHNQFLQTFVATGILGFLLLLLLFIIPFIKSIKSNDFLYFSFLLMIFLNLLTESMLEKQVGVVFFAFFNTILFSNVNRVSSCDSYQ